MRNRLAVALLSLVAALTFSAALPGQGSNRAPTDLASKPSNVAGNTDISGVWNAVSGIYQYAAFSKDDPPMTPWGQSQFNAAKPSQGPRGVKLSETNDQVYKCAPPGMPYIYIQLFPV